jgi:hypothetical protein
MKGYDLISTIDVFRGGALKQKSSLASFGVAKEALVLRSLLLTLWCLQALSISFPLLQLSTKMWYDIMVQFRRCPTKAITETQQQETTSTTTWTILGLRKRFSNSEASNK